MPMHGQTSCGVLMMNDNMSGGRADGKSPRDFPREALQEGVKVEMEHTDDRNIAVEIAMDHLTEDINYYKKLKTIHKNSYGATMIDRDIELIRGKKQYGSKVLNEFDEDKIKRASDGKFGSKSSGSKKKSKASGKKSRITEMSRKMDDTPADEKAVREDMKKEFADRDKSKAGDVKVKGLKGGKPKSIDAKEFARETKNLKIRKEKYETRVKEGGEIGSHADKALKREGKKIRMEEKRLKK